MTLGIIGAGGIGQAIATRALRAGVDVWISNRRGPESLGDVVQKLGDGARAVPREEAATAEIVVVAVTWESLPAALEGLPEWKGRIVIDPSNPLIAPDFHPADLGGRTSSEIVADLVPEARLVKTFNTLTPELIVADPPPGGRRALFVSGDHEAAKGEVSRLLYRMGFAAIDLGGLVEGGRMHQFPGGPLAGQNLVRFPMN